MPNTSSRSLADEAVPPPIPPPRKVVGARSASSRKQNGRQVSSLLSESSKTSADTFDGLGGSSGVEKFIDTSASESGSPVPSSKKDHTRETSNNLSLFDSLRPNSSAACLDAMMQSQKSKEELTKLPIVEENSLFNEYTPIALAAGSSSPTEFPARARPPIVGAYTQKAIPFRSASFSQVDYSSGKYIRSALGALKASFVKSKSPPRLDPQDAVPQVCLIVDGLQYLCSLSEPARSISP